MGCGGEPVYVHVYMYTLRFTRYRTTVHTHALALDNTCAGLANVGVSKNE